MSSVCPEPILSYSQVQFKRGAFHIALSDTQGHASFALGVDASQGRLTDERPPGDRARPTLDVATRTLDALVQELQITRLRLVKIDVEGAEEKVLRGAEQTLRTLKPYLLIDLHVAPEHRQRIMSRLSQFGYTLDPASPARWWGLAGVPPRS